MCACVFQREEGKVHTFLEQEEGKGEEGDSSLPSSLTRPRGNRTHTHTHTSVPLCPPGTVTVPCRLERENAAPCAPVRGKARVPTVKLASRA